MQFRRKPDVRWPLRNQILVRMLLLLFITTVALTFANIRSTIIANRDLELGRLQRLVELAETSRFPLTPTVLEDMKSLSGAEFELAEKNGEVIAKTTAAPNASHANEQIFSFSREQSPEAIVIGGQPFYYAAVENLRVRDRMPAAGILRIFVPRESRQAIWWKASKSPLTIALLVLPIALLLSLAVASQVTRPLANLKNQVQRIAEGDVQRIPPIKGSDEIQGLSLSINEMATKLEDHDVQLRKNERLRTMVQFGSSIAHHLRNSATGCKMAVELLAAENQSIEDSDNYQVAVRQLGLMNNYIRKFLLSSKSPNMGPSDETRMIDLNRILENVVFLLSPSAQHLNVDLKVETDCDGSKVKISEEDAEQLMMNLITNGITAASQNAAESIDHGKALVSIELQVQGDRVVFSVADSGAGPAPEIAEQMFQPFVTGSKEGTGLGLSLVAEISDRAGGCVKWNRENGMTIFTFETKNEIKTTKVT